MSIYYRIPALRHILQLEYTCSQYCNLIGLSEVHYSDRDLQAKIETYNFYKIYKIVLISRKLVFFSVPVIPKTELFPLLAMILLPHTFPSSCYCCLVGSSGSFNQKNKVKVATKEALMIARPLL